MSATNIKQELRIDVTTGQVQRIIKGNGNLARSLQKKAPKMKQEHKVNHVKFAYNSICNQRDWTKIIFSDENKFNLNGPDRFCHYWQDIWKEQELFSKRQGGGGVSWSWQPSVSMFALT